MSFGPKLKKKKILKKLVDWAPRQFFGRFLEHSLYVVNTLRIDKQAVYPWVKEKTLQRSQPI